MRQRPRLQTVQSEGSLPVVSEASMPKRKRGFTTMERLCFRRVPIASPKFSSKVEEWSQARPRARSYSSLHALPSEGPTPCSRLQPKQEVHRPRVYGTLVSPQPVQEPPGSLAAQEQTCATILRNIYPSTLTGMAFFMKHDRSESPEISFIDRRPLIYEPRVSSLGPPSSAQRNGSKSTGSRSSVNSPERVMSKEHPRSPERVMSKDHPRMSSREMRKSIVEESRINSKELKKSIPTAQIPELQLIHRKVMFDSGTASPIGKNALRLIQGAAETRRNHRQIRRKSLMQLNTRRAPIFDFASQMASLLSLRQKILEAHPCFEDAFAALNAEHGDLDKREWCSALNSAKLCPLPEARAIYELMDADHDGTLTPIEFQFGLEVIGQVTTMEILRKRLLCLGFQSMKQAITVMNGEGPDITMQPLSFTDFAVALKRVFIIETEEHRAIFNSIRDPGDHLARASLSDLACGLAVVSPCLLLEDLRHRMTEEHGTLEEALQVLIPLELHQHIHRDAFKRNACEYFGTTDQEAEWLFKSIDLDGDGAVSRDEVRRALNLAEPCLDFEECRQRLRQGCRTIERALTEAYSNKPEEEDMPSEMHFETREFFDVLNPTGLGLKHVTRLVELMSVSEKGITLLEFFSGIRLFAPSCALDEVKMQLLQSRGGVEAAFRNIEERRLPLCHNDFDDLLKRLGVRCEETEKMFDFLDVRCTGITTVSEVIAALQCLQPGRHKILSHSERHHKVKQDVGKIFRPALRYASELKANVKEDAFGVPVDVDSASAESAEEGERAETARSVATTRTAGTAASGYSRKLRGRITPGQNKQTSKGVGSKAPLELDRGLLMRKTFVNITSSLHALPPSDEQKCVSEFVAYFTSNGDVLSEQKPFVEMDLHLSEELPAKILEKLRSPSKRSRSATDSELVCSS